MMREYFKSVLYRSRVLEACHKVRNRRTLTTVIFHRVLPREDVRWSFADPEWTVSDQFFEDCLSFFTDHYNVISTDDLLAWSQSASELPERALLITFDDGWADVSEYGLPALQRRSLPATVFVIACEVNGLEPWQEVVRRAWRRGQLTPDRLSAGGFFEADESPVPERAELSDWIEWLSRMPAGRRSVLLARLRQQLGEVTPRQMMSREQVLQLSACGAQVGSHGLTHTSVTSSPAPWEELSGARTKLADLLGKDHAGGPELFSFPNGRYDSAALRMAAAAGYREMFTSEPCLNILPAERGGPLVLGRVNIPAGPLSDEQGKLRRELLALWLFSRPKRSIPYPKEISE
jgi:peptidoglycan/xylan/chitin deacetylase (PgdA/CDA1 family)